MSNNSAFIPNDRTNNVVHLKSASTAEGNGVAMICAAAGLSLAVSVYLFFSGSVDHGLFVGLWVPSILSLGALLREGVRHD